MMKSLLVWKHLRCVVIYGVYEVVMNKDVEVRCKVSDSAGVIMLYLDSYYSSRVILDAS